MFEYLHIVESVMSSLARIPGTVVRNPEEVEEGIRKLERAAELIKEAKRLLTGRSATRELVTKMEFALQYGTNDLRIRLQAWRMAQGGGWDDGSVGMARLLKERRELLAAHQDDGIFLVKPQQLSY